MRHLTLLVFLLTSLITSAANAQGQQYAGMWISQQSLNKPGFLCLRNDCGIQVGFGTFSGLVTAGSFSTSGSFTSTGDMHGGTLTADGAGTFGSVYTGAMSATDILASTLNLSGAATVGALTSSSENTGNLSASSANVGNTTTTKDLVVTGSTSTPGWTSDPNGQTTFAKPPQGMSTSICTNLSAALPLTTLNKATPVATLTGAALKTSLPCSVAPPAGNAADVDTFCRVTSAGNATIYARSALIGQSASSGQWCAVVVGS